MECTIVVHLLGVLAFSEDNQLIDKIVFPKKPRVIAQNLDLVANGQMIEEVSRLVQKLEKSGYRNFIFASPTIANTIKEKHNVKAEFAKTSVQAQLLDKNLEKIAIEIGFVKKPEEIRELIRKVSTELTRLKIKKAGEKRDLLSAQAILTIDDLDKTANLFMNRIREWYGLHFPELDRIVEEHETYARLVLKLGERSNFTLKKLDNKGLPSNKATQITEAAAHSMGSELTRADLTQIQELCKQTIEIYTLRRNIEEYTEATVRKAAPNLHTLAGPLLAARLIALAGGLSNLAKMPASTIQVLGAEKALFRSLKTGTKPPKHGAIFQQASVHEAKKWQRGKMSRAVAGKLAIAARTDAFSGRYIGDSLKTELEQRIEEIKQKYRRAPPNRKEKPKKIRAKTKRRRKRRGNRR